MQKYRLYKYLKTPYSPRELWRMNRLGLYRTVANQAWVIPHPRSCVVITIAKIKRRQLSSKVACRQIRHYLTIKIYKPYRLELIKETIGFFPNFYRYFFMDNPRDLADPDYLYYFLSVACQDDLFKLNLSNEQLFLYLNNHINGICLLNNLGLLSDKLSIFNKILLNHQLHTVKLKTSSLGFSVFNIVSKELSKNNSFCLLSANNKVSVIVTCYQAEQTIEACLDSLIRQTWKNIQIIVVDDASTDGTVDMVRQMAKLDSRILLITLPENVGTFVAKNIGAKYATGVFLTCHDSDDWAHPQKIAEQVLPLIENSHLMVTTSYWLKFDDGGLYYARQCYPFFRQNPASPMFRLRQVIADTGLWHMARTGADSEFWQRLKMIYGKDRICVIKKPLTLGSHRCGSLMNSSAYGVFNTNSALTRLDYWENWRLWHIEQINQGKFVKMPPIEQQIKQQSPFAVPKSIDVNRTIVRKCLL